MHPESPIGIFDSGLGGLTVLKELRRALPDEHFIYLGDTARTPYGSKGPETIIRYSRECASFLRAREVKLLVVACNTASSTALETLREESACPVIGTIDAAVELAISSSSSKRIGVIGTETTIESGCYQAALTQRGEPVSVFAKACPLFVPLVEQGMVEGEITEKAVEHYLSSLRSEKIDALVLGCTHYPLLKKSISQFLGAQVSIVECSKGIAIEAAKLLDTHTLRAEKGRSPREEYFVTDGVHRFNRLAELFLRNGPVEATQIESLG